MYIRAQDSGLGTSIEDAVDDPRFRRAILRDTAGQAAVERDVPLVAIPSATPPAARTAPWSCRNHHVTADVVGIHAHRAACTDTNTGRARRTEAADDGGQMARP